MEHAQGTKPERLKSLMKALKIRNVHLAKAIKTAPAFISQLRNGHQNITIDFAYRISKSYPNVNVDWLMKGEGTMFLADKNISVVAEPDMPYQADMDDPTAGLRGLLEYFQQRIDNLEKRVSLLEGRRGNND